MAGSLLLLAEGNRVDSCFRRKEGSGKANSVGKCDSDSRLRGNDGWAPGDRQARGWGPARGSVERLFFVRNQNGAGGGAVEAGGFEGQKGEGVFAAGFYVCEIKALHDDAVRAKDGQVSFGAVAAESLY